MMDCYLFFISELLGIRRCSKGVHFVILDITSCMDERITHFSNMNIDTKAIICKQPPTEITASSSGLFSSEGARSGLSFVYRDVMISKQTREENG